MTVLLNVRDPLFSDIKSAGLEKIQGDYINAITQMHLKILLHQLATMPDKLQFATMQKAPLSAKLLRLLIESIIFIGNLWF